MKYPVHESDTGSFQELVRRGDLEFGQLSILEIAPGCSRGGHYHRRKHEWFCCIKGICELVAASQLHEVTFTLQGDQREFIRVPAGMSHTLSNVGQVDFDTTCLVLVIASEPYDPDDPDTFTLEELSR